MSKWFELHDPVEKKYIFNSFLVFVGLVEVIILAATIVWQIDEGWFGGEVRIIPFPWKEYLLASSMAPVVMLLVFGIIVRGFDLLNPSLKDSGEDEKKFWHRLRHKFSLISYIIGLSLLAAFFYAIYQPEKVLRYLKALFSALGLWGAYVVIGIIALSMLYFPISLLLRYRLAKKAMEYQYLLALAERHGVVFDKDTGTLIPTQVNPERALPPVSEDAEDMPPTHRE